MLKSELKYVHSLARLFAFWRLNDVWTNNSNLILGYIALGEVLKAKYHSIEMEKKWSSLKEYILKCWKLRFFIRIKLLIAHHDHSLVYEMNTIDRIKICNISCGYRFKHSLRCNESLSISWTEWERESEWEREKNSRTVNIVANN